MVRIAPSLLAADFSRLGEELARVESADLLHVDVMDGDFVPNLSIGPGVVRAIRGCSALPFDVHLMLRHPLPYVPVFRAAGADRISFHLEAADDPLAVLAAIRESGALPGMAISPGTPARALAPFAGLLNSVIVMTVEPGFGGQKLIPETLDKLGELHALLPGVELAVDGGVDRATAPACVAAGADILVAGTAVFRARDPAEAIQALRFCAGQGTTS